MSLFNKLFGKSGQEVSKSGIERPDIDKLLLSDNLNNSIIELDNYICSITGKLTGEQENFFHNQELEREVNNGGFDLYFRNLSGDFAHETVKSLKIIGAHTTATILQEAIDQFPDNSVPSDRDVRHKLMDQLDDTIVENWSVLDDRFFLYEDDLNALNMAYVKANKDKF